MHECINVCPIRYSLKTEIVKDAVRLGVPYELTWTCYNPQKIILDKKRPGPYIRYVPCLKCEACVEREKAGKEAGVKDINDYKQEDYINYTII